MSDATRAGLPPVTELGPDLLRITPRQRWLTVATPFACVAAYAAFGHLR